MPLSHVAANLVDLIIMMSCHGTTYFAEKTALKGTITKTLKVSLLEQISRKIKVYSFISQNVVRDWMPYPLITDVLGSPTNNVLWCTTSIWEDSRKNAGGKNQIWYRCLNIMSKSPNDYIRNLNSSAFL